MHRFFVEASQIDTVENQVSIVGNDVNHIKNVLRMTEGEKILVSCGDEQEYTCQISALSSEEVVASISECKSAGIKVLMITGDHPLTAFSIAKELDLTNDYKEVEKRIKAYALAFEYQWLYENHPSGFDVQDRRLGAIIQRTASCRRRLLDYASGRILSIPELEENLLPFKGKEKESRLALFF